MGRPTKDAQLLKKLRWVESVTRRPRPKWMNADYDPGYILITKPNSLRVTVTADALLVNGYPLPAQPVEGNPVPVESFTVPLPQLAIKLGEVRYDTFVKVTEKPDTPYKYFLPYPAYDTSAVQVERWDNWAEPCWGLWGENYENAGTWLERAEVLALYMQSATPHRWLNRFGVSFAYFMGKMPKERCTEVTLETVPKDIAEYIPQSWDLMRMILGGTV